MITPPSMDFSRPIQNHTGWDGEKSLCLVGSENPSLESLENLLSTHYVILGAVHLASGPSLSNRDLFQGCKSVILHAKGSVARCLQCFLLTHPHPPASQMTGLAITSNAAIPETTESSKSVWVSQRELLLKCHLCFSCFFLLFL